MLELSLETNVSKSKIHTVLNLSKYVKSLHEENYRTITEESGRFGERKTRCFQENSSVQLEYGFSVVQTSLQDVVLWKLNKLIMMFR